MMSGRSLSAVVRDWGDVKWSAVGNQPAGYLGWTNRGNLGDEAMYQAACAVAPSQLRRVPLHRPGRALASLGRCRVLVIGGGTLLARREWLERAVYAQQLLRPVRTIVMGTGVEPLDFGQSRGTTDRESATANAAFLRSCDFVGVRGPRSQMELAREGVLSEVVGDPALAVAHVEGRLPSERRTIAINLAAVSNGLDLTRKRTEREIVRVARNFKSHDWRVVFFAMEKSDEHYTRDLIGSDFDLLPWMNDVPRLRAFLSYSDAVLSERLHGGILAAACGTPFIQVGYKPKTYDFAESIGAAHLVRDPLSLDGDDLTSEIIAQSARGLSCEVRSSVEDLGQRYRDRMSNYLQ